MKTFKLLSISRKIATQTTTKSDPLDQLSGNWELAEFTLLFRPINRNDIHSNTIKNIDKYLDSNDKIETCSIPEKSKEIANSDLLQQKINHLNGIIHLQLIQNTNNLHDKGSLQDIYFEPRLWLIMPKTDQTSQNYYTSCDNMDSFFSANKKEREIKSTTTSFQRDANLSIESIMENDAIVSTPIAYSAIDLMNYTGLRWPPISVDTLKKNFFINVG